LPGCREPAIVLGMNNTRAGRRVEHSLIVALTFTTKTIGLSFDADAQERLNAILGEVCHDFESDLLELRAEKDTLRLVVRYPPKHSVSGLINSLKGVSSRLLLEERPDIRLLCDGGLWSPSYTATSLTPSTGGA
jgi:putative transposase